jgi:NADH dehydrogenase
MDPFARTDIVIIGGGFGGMNAAMALDLRLRRGLKIEVTLITRSNFFLFTPLLAEVAASLVESRHAVSPIRRMLSRVRFIEGTVQTVDPVRRRLGRVSVSLWNFVNHEWPIRDQTLEPVTKQV